MSDAAPLGRRAFALGCLVLFAVGVGARWLAGLGDDGLGGQDPWGYLDAARATGAWLIGHAPPPTGFFWPLGYPALGAVASLATGVPEATALRTLSTLLGAAAGPLLAWTVVVAHGPSARRAGLLAGAVLALGAAATLAGAAVMADAAMVFWLVVAALATAPTVRADAPVRGLPARLGLGAVAGAALGLAIVTRQASLVAAPALGIAWLLAAAARRVPRPALLTFGAALALPLLAQLALDVDRPGALDHAWLRSWRPWHAVMRTFDTPDGHASYPWPQGVYALFPLLHPGYLAPPLGLFALRGLRRAWCGEGAAGCAPVGPFGALLWAQWLGVGVLFFAGMPFQNFRFGLVVLPAAAVLFGLGAADALGAGAQVGTRGRLARGALVLGALWTLAWTPRMARQHVQARAERRATVAAVAAAARTVADGAFAEPRPPLLVAFELTADLRHREGVEAVELWDL
ncbi:MAG: hypothetical protein RIT45_3163, partial [Pseudomonadota bacterium]